jgi:hypothetical protein
MKNKHLKLIYKTMRKITNSILLILLITLTVSCKQEKTTEQLVTEAKELSAQVYMHKYAEKINKQLGLPKRFDEYTIAEKSYYDSEENALIVNYKTNGSLLFDNYGVGVKKYFKEIENNDIKTAIELYKDNPNFKLLKVNLGSVYRDLDGEIINTYLIKPEQYLK